MTIRKVLQWTAFLAVLLAAATGAALYWAWRSADLLLRERSEAAFARHVPGWDVSFADCELGADGAVRFFDVTLRTPGDGDPLLNVEEVAARIDRSLFVRHQRVVFRSIELRQPTVWLTRSADGEWNWERLTPPPKSDAACPPVRIHRGTVIVHVDRSESVPQTEFLFRRVNARLSPSARRQYRIDAQTDVDHAGALALEGSLNLKTGDWAVHGSAAAVNTNDGLLEMAAGLSPELRHQMQGLAGGEGQSDIATASDPRPGDGALGPPVMAAAGSVAGTTAPAAADDASATGPASQFRLPELGLGAEMDVTFEIAGGRDDATPSYALLAVIRDGQIVNDGLPIPLFGLQGTISVTDDEIVIDDLRAANGGSELFVSGRVERSAAALTKDLTVRAINLEIARSVQKYLHVPQLRRAYEMLSPAGRFNLDVHVRHDGGDDWDVTLNEFTALGCSVVHEDFDYPVSDITGSIRQDEDAFVVDLDGRAGERPLSIDGRLRGFGPESEILLHVEIDDLPLDERFVNALQASNQQPARRALQVLDLQGLADVEADFIRRPHDERCWMTLDVFVHDASLNYERFPYRLTALQGRIMYDPLVEPVWHFRELRARHREATLTGHATYDVHAPPGRLDLHVTARQARLDADLHSACLTAKPGLGALWREYAPSGTVDVEDLTLTWRPGAPIQLALPTIHVSNGRFNVAALPYQWEQVEGTFAWSGNRIDIEHLQARHGETYLEINGRDATQSAYVAIAPRQNVAWNLHLDDVKIRRLDHNAELRRALPEGLANVVGSLDIQGEVDVDLGIDLKASAHAKGLVTAHWWMRTALAGNDLFLGMDLRDAHGNIEIVNGVWDGTAVTADGYVNLTSVEALDMPFRRVQGPFAIDGDRLTIGMPDWPDWQPRPPLHSAENPFAGRELQVADIYADERHEGRLGVNGVVLLGADPEQTRYRVDMVLRGASLRKWADDRQLRNQRLNGAVNGVISITGRGTSDESIRGEGWVEIKPAQLYELPLLARVFREIRFDPLRAGGDDTAFHYALAEFTIHDGRFDFARIDLIGDVINLVGWGEVAFAEPHAGALDLHFLTEVRNQIPGLNLIPLLSQTVDFFGKHWLHVSVTGTLQQPVARTDPNVPLVSDAVRGVMQALGAGRTPPAPSSIYSMPRLRMPSRPGDAAPPSR